MHEVIALHQPQEKCSSKIWQSKVVVFRPLHQIETKHDECEEEASLLNLEFNREGKAQCHILNKMIKKNHLDQKNLVRWKLYQPYPVQRPCYSSGK